MSASQLWGLFWGLSWGLLLPLAGCTPASVAVKASPKDAIAALAKRFESDRVQLDPAGSSPTRLRSAYYCYQAPKLRTTDVWAGSFASPTSGRAPFEVDAPMAEQRPEAQRCEFLFRFSIGARAAEGTRLEVEVEWWRAHATGCKPIGDPLMAVSRCRYSYRGAVGPADPTRWIQSRFNGL